MLYLFLLCCIFLINKWYTKEIVLLKISQNFAPTWAVNMKLNFSCHPYLNCKPYKITLYWPVSMASMRASVSLLRIQSISWRCVFSPAESMRRNRGSNWPVLPPPLAPRDRALRPSNSRTSSRSTNLMVSKQHLLNTAITTFIETKMNILTRNYSDKCKAIRAKNIYDK